MMAPAPGGAFAPGQAMHALVEQHARDRPHAPALREDGTTLDYRTLDRRANAVARALVRRGVGPGDLVGLCLPRSAAALVALLGILKTGAAYVAVDPSHPAAWRDAVLADAQPRHVVGVSGRLAAADDEVEALLSSGAEDEPLSRPPDPGSARMYVAYTSGSTGRPKGVVVSHANVARLFPALCPWMQFGSDDIWTMVHSPAFGFSVWEIWGAWCHGACLVVVPPRLSMAPSAMFDLLAAERVTVLSQTPTAFRQLATELRRGTRRPPLPDLRWIAFSGEPLPAQILAPWLDAFGAERPSLANLYALTETSGEVFFHRVTPADLDAAASCIGRPLDDVDARLLDPAGQPVADGEVGELWLGGPAIAQGYLNQPALTAERFTPPPGCTNARWFRTRDMARRLADGTHWFAGRADRQIKRRGYRVEPGAVEAALRRELAVLDAVVQSEADAASDAESLVAYLVLREPGPVPAGLAARLAAAVPHYAVPDRFVAVPALPLTPNGKLDVETLRALAASAPSSATAALHAAAASAAAAATAFSSAAAAPHAASASDAGAGAASPRADAGAPDDTEATLAEIWAELLDGTDARDLGPEDDFFDLGGHSLLTLHLTLAIEERLGVTVSMTDVFEAPTLRALAALVRTLRDPMRDPMRDQVRDSTDASAAERVPATQVPVDRDEPHGPYMRLAIDEARRALADGQPPYAACIVKDGEVVALAHNRIWRHTDATAHAEIEAIREACRRLDSIDLQGCVMYSTAEPCSMCLTAGVWAGIGTLVYGVDMADEERFGLAQPTVPAARMQQQLGRPLTLVPGVGRGEMRVLFEQWLRIRALTA